jgi:CHAT domain-containing protein
MHQPDGQRGSGRGSAGDLGRAFRNAIDIGEATQNAILSSLGLGSLGRLAERNGKLDEAAPLTDRALFAAQQTSAPELLFRWEWQKARLLLRRGLADSALESYRRAVVDLRRARQDIPVEYRAGQSSYLATFGPVYREFADLLLRRPSAEPARAAALLREARDTIEALKESEMQDYFRDSCVTNFEAKRRSIDEEVFPGTAILYPVVLHDRLELLVSIGGQQRRFVVPLPGERLRQEVRQLRPLLEKRTTNEFLPLSQELYDQIVRPIDPWLTANQIDTLVLVPDDALRLIPFAALHDGSRFLIERYATAIVPSLRLTDPTPLNGQARGALVSGLSQAFGGFAALPYVKGEVAEVHRLQGGMSLLNADFSRSRFDAELKGFPFSVVHIASHGQFGNDPSRTYVLAFDRRLTMDDLEKP